VFDIVIPTFNNLNELKDCLNSLTSESAHINKIIVCVDGSTDGTWEWLHDQSSLMFSMISIQHEDGENHGRQATRNLGFEHTESDYIVFLDSDFTVKSGILKEYEKEIRHHDVVLSNICFINSDSNHWAHYLTSRQHKTIGKSILPVEYYVSGCVVINRNVFEKAGKFDEQIITYGGDLAFSMQLKSIGIRSLRRAPNAVVEGRETKTSVQVIRQHQQIIEGTLPYLLNKYGTDKSYPYHLETILRMNKIFPLRKITVLHALKQVIPSVLEYSRPNWITDSVLRLAIVLTMVASCND